MKEFWQKWSGPIALFLSGADFERVTSGGTETYFGTHWLLILFTASLFAIGVSRIARLSLVGQQDQ